MRFCFHSSRTFSASAVHIGHQGAVEADSNVPDPLSPHGAGSDQIAIQRAVEKYEDIDLQFAGSREGNLLRVRVSTVHVPLSLLYVMSLQGHGSSVVRVSGMPHPGVRAQAHTSNG
jgi:hypothetical protein